MKIFTKTFLYTLALLVLIALLASGLIYTLLPKAYTDQKSKDLMQQTDQLVDQLEKAKRSEVTDLMAEYAGNLQANLTIDIGSDSYTMLTWNGGVITQVDESDALEPGTAIQEDTPDSSDSRRLQLFRYAVSGRTS